MGERDGRGERKRGREKARMGGGRRGGAEQEEGSGNEGGRRREGRSESESIDDSLRRPHMIATLDVPPLYASIYIYMRETESFLENECG